MLHHLTFLRRTRCRPLFFDAQWYLDRYGDVAAAGLDPLQHYLRWGRDEGRLPCLMMAAWRERDVRWGLSEADHDTLDALARNTAGDIPRADQVWATLACARLQARNGNWGDAQALLRGLDPEREILRGFCLPDSALLSIEADVMAGDLAAARQMLTQARALFGALPDLTLAEANILAADAGHDAAWTQVLAPLYRRAGKISVAVDPAHPDQPAFDRLRPAGSVRPNRRGPLISVIVPAFNAETTLATTLRSLRDQSWGNLEILVVDNGSTDRTAEIARIAARQDPRIRLLDGHAEPGTYGARNLGMAQASGAFVTVLDADDWAHPDRIAQQARALTGAQAPVASLAHWVRTTPDLRFTRWWREEGLTHPDISSLMIRAEAREALGFWDRARAAADTEYHLRLQARFGPKSVIEVLPGIPLSFGRVRPQSLTQARETGIGSHLFGARRDYQLAGQRWHLRMQERGDLPLPQYPKERPYQIPAALALPAANDPPPRADDAEWLAACGLYDDSWYMQSYPDLRIGEVDGHLHYATTGEAEDRDPGPGFSTSGYRMAHGPFSGSPLRHYLQEGRAQGLSPLPVFEGALPPPAAGRHVLVFGHQARAHVFGAERCLIDLLERLQAAGMTPSVVLPHIQNPDYLELLKARAHQVHVRPYGWIFGGVPPHPATVAGLADLIRSSGAVEIHQNTAVMDAPLRAARRVGIPSMVHVHELPAQDPRLCMDLGCSAEELRHLLLRHADRFSANSQAVADWLGLPADQVALLPNRINPDLQTLPFAPTDPPRVALIGSLIAKKGVRDFAEVARQFARMGGEAQFLLIGPETPDLKRLGDLPTNLRHAGYVPDPVAAMRQADIVLSLSHFAESFGLTVLEAMAAGRPVICYDRGTPPTLLGEAGAGVVTAADDTAAVAKALRALIADDRRLEAASKAARARAAVLIEGAETASLAALEPPSIT